MVCSSLFLNMKHSIVCLSCRLKRVLGLCIVHFVKGASAVIYLG